MRCLCDYVSTSEAYKAQAIFKKSNFQATRTDLECRQVYNLYVQIGTLHGLISVELPLE